MNLWQDIRYGARTLGKSPGFAVTAVLIMALGIGVNTAIFSVCDAMLWKPVPLPHLDSLVTVTQAVPDDSHQWNPATPADINDIRRQCTSLAGLAGWQNGLANLAGSSAEPERVSQALVAANFFDVVGVQPIRGRGFQAGEDQKGHEREVILSDGLWRRRYGADPAILGQTIHLDDESYTIIGVMPSNFDFPLATQLWTPMALPAGQLTDRRFQSLASIGRLKPGATVEQAKSEIDGIGARLAKLYPDTNNGRAFLVWPALRFLVDYETRSYLMMLLYSVMFVLLIACANVANLQFARATGRSREIAVRRALGAGRGRIVTQFLTENILLSIAGAAAGLLLAKWGIRAMQAGMPAEVRQYIVGWSDMAIDQRTLLFTMAAAILSGILAGISPAWHVSQPNLTDELKEGGRGSSKGKARQRLRNALVVAEVALAVVLLVGASLMVRGFRAIVNTGAAMQPSTLLTMRLALTAAKYPEKHRIAEFYQQVVERIKSIPGVQTATAVSAIPFSDHSNGRNFTIEGVNVDPADTPSGMYQVASPEYFQTLHVPLRAGRFLSAADGADAPKVVVISELVVKRWLRNQSPIGRRLKIGDANSKNPWMTIVGVVGDMVHSPYDHAPRRTIYVPYQQSPALWMDIGVRTKGDPLNFASAVTAAIHSVDPEQPVTDMHTLATSIHNRAIGLNYMAALMGIFGGIALLLSAIGVYGVMAFLVSERTHEIGIRIALGASRGSVLGSVFSRGMITAGSGLLIGLPLSFGFSQLMTSLIVGVSANDLTTFIGIPLVLLAAAAVAIYVPAHRAMRIDPIVALRYE